MHAVEARGDMARAVAGGKSGSCALVIRSRRQPGRPRIDSELRAIIRRMSAENFLWGAPRIHGELLKLGIAVSERTVSRYRPDRTRGRSQTWRTFLRNHVGAISCHAVVASSARPGDDDVVDTGLFSRGLTPPSGTAARLQPHGDCRRNSLGSTHVSWLAGCLGPTFTTGRDRPVPAAIRHGHVPLRLAKTRTQETPSSGCALRLGEHGQSQAIRSRDMPDRDRAIRGRCVRGRLHECADKADTPRLRPKRASASIPLSGRSFGEAQDLAQDRRDLDRVGPQ